MTDILTLLNNPILGLLALALAEIADVITTIRAIRRGGREGNPIIARMMQRMGKYGWVAVKLAGATIAAIVIVHSGPVWVLFPLAAITAFVAWHNHRAMR